MKTGQNCLCSKGEPKMWCFWGLNLSCQSRPMLAFAPSNNKSIVANLGRGEQCFPSKVSILENTCQRVSLGSHPGPVSTACSKACFEGGCHLPDFVPEHHSLGWASAHNLPSGLYWCLVGQSSQMPAHLSHCSPGKAEMGWGLVLVETESHSMQPGCRALEVEADPFCGEQDPGWVSMYSFRVLWAL
jgi:hypothetical protein